MSHRIYLQKILLGQLSVKLACKLRLLSHANMLVNYLTVFKDKECRNISNPKLSRYVRVAINIHFANYSLSFIIFR